MCEEQEVPREYFQFGCPTAWISHPQKRNIHQVSCRSKHLHILHMLSIKRAVKKMRNWELISGLPMSPLYNIRRQLLDSSIIQFVENPNCDRAKSNHLRPVLQSMYLERSKREKTKKGGAYKPLWLHTKYWGESNQQGEILKEQRSIWFLLHNHPPDWAKYQEPNRELSKEYLKKDWENEWKGVFLPSGIAHLRRSSACHIVLLMWGSTSKMVKVRRKRVKKKNLPFTASTQRSDGGKSCDEFNQNEINPIGRIQDSL